MSNEMSNDKMTKLTYAFFAAAGLSLIAVIYLLSVQFGHGSVKIGYVKSDVLLAQYKPAMSVQQRMQLESVGAQKELEGRYKELQDMDADLQNKLKVLTQQALAPQIEKFQKKQNEFYQLQQGHQQALQQKQAQLLEPIFQDISNFINKYGKDHGYTVILGTPMEGLVVYGDSGADLTDTILTELNAKVPPTMPVPFETGKADSAKK
ncbi:OmpH family outer membrane protein [bacterium]|nr:OmpH family outer membrane protein [bacterium]MBL7995473.1 OmpH family outer membrane protein [bacterium]